MISIIDRKAETHEKHSNLMGWFLKLYPFLMFLFNFERERERERESERMGEGQRERETRIWSRLQALSCQHRAQHGAQTHEPRDYDLSRSRMLNWLSHPGTPVFFLFKSTRGHNKLLTIYDTLYFMSMKLVTFMKSIHFFLEIFQTFFKNFSP